MTGIPLWALFGLLAAVLSAVMMLLQERFKTPGLAMAFWNKVTCAVVMVPFAIAAGLPTNPLFYILLAGQSVLWVISNVIFFRGVSEAGAGVISRLLPMATIVSFLLWFALDWQLASAYAAQPLHSTAIFSVLCLSAYCTYRMKSCPVTWGALRSIWFVVVANIFGTVGYKFIAQQADMTQGTHAFVLCQALMMIAMWLAYYAIKRPLPASVMFGAAAIKSGLAVGVVSAVMVAATIYAVYHVDNPAYVPAVKYLDSVLILLFYRITGRPNRSHVWASLGIVACAAVLVILKAHA